MSMHRYLMSVPKYFGGEFRFEVEAEDKIQAKEKAREYLENSPYRSNFMKDHIECVRKLKPSFGEEYDAKMRSMM